MTDWGSSEERDFQRLVRQAEQQSEDYYRRAGGGLPRQAVPVPVPPPPPPPLPTPPPPKAHYRVKRKSPLPMLDIDSETAVLVALLWLLWQEQADFKVILAVVYILLV